MVTNRDGKSFQSHLEISKICSDYWNRWRFWLAFRHFGTHFAESFRMSKYSWMMDPSLSREMPSFSATELDEIRRSSKISLWIWSIIYGLVIVPRRPVRGTSRVEKLPRLTWATYFLTVEYIGEFPLLFLSGWREFLSALCLVLKKKLCNRSRPDVEEIARVSWHASFLHL